MKCERCGGLTIDVSFSGGITATAAWEYDGCKCLNCGYITDPLIMKNKTQQSPGLLKNTSSFGIRHGNAVPAQAAV